jgi:hypothetical protein
VVSRRKSFSLGFFVLVYLNNIFLSGSDARDDSIESAYVVKSLLSSIKALSLIAFVGILRNLYIINNKLAMTHVGMI